MPPTFYQTQLEEIRDKYFPPEYFIMQVRNSKEFMDNHYWRNVDIDEIAKTAFLSKYHFIRSFKSLYGQTPHQYLKDIRIEKAKHLLKSDMPLQDVCLAVGYESMPSFSNFFKKAAGLTPLAYRQLQNSNFE